MGIADFFDNLEYSGNEKEGDHHKRTPQFTFLS